MLLPALAAMWSVQAQQINGYRYWFDDNVAGAVTTSVAATDELNLAANWPTGALAPGYHRVSFQMRDTNGDWSVPQTKHFTRSGKVLTGYRFWVNDAMGTLTTASIGPNALVDLNNLIDPGTLTRDYNIVTFQFQDADGEWSVPTSSAFVKNTGLVNGYEWWIDDAIADRTSSPIGPGGVVDLIAELPTGLPAGSYTFTIRFSSANGTWSVPLSSAFDSFVGIAELPGVTDLLLFPNPVSEQLGLRLSSDAARTLNLQVLDLSGAVVMDLNSWPVSGTATRQWDIGGLASGTYLLRITGADGSWTTRFVKP